ncbi:ankyrin-1-like isoform X2 [Actinia tenebrosa]|uniref:Ankyrin-1-like isoform X2 n=1 Tax=Actinia tenebrosa TaxID=6105 RepID=A0A6P8IV61_ACTTE|nr:ankyrin-1-like isoform X2 [Actinia tenebrosa]
MAKDRQSKGEKVRAKSYRNPNLLSHYHELSTRVFYNGGRANEYLHNLFLKAAKNGEEERIRNFLARSSKNSNVNLNYKDKTTGNTAVVLAASRNHVNIVKMLLNYGADITLLNDQGQSIFDLAPDSMIPMLLASVERQGTSHRHLLQAAWQGNLQILRQLLSSQASLDVNCKNADGMTPLLLVTRDVNLFEKIEKNIAEKGYNPLEVVKELLQHKADCSITASDGKSPLHYITHNMGPKAKDMANLIIEDTNSKLELSDKSNNHPIHLASRYDNRPVLLALINGGADVNARGQLGQTPLHVAAAHGHERCSSALLSSGADVTIVDDQGYSPVDVCKNRKVKLVLKAWVEQTREASSQLRCSYSAPTGLVNDEVNTIKENVPESVLSPRAKKQTSPRKISGDTLLPPTFQVLVGVMRGETLS